jgi:hypothetical protein
MVRRFLSDGIEAVNLFGGMTMGKQNELGWFGSFWAKRARKKAEEAEVAEATEKIVEIADPQIRGSSGYSKSLKQPVVDATRYCSGLMEAVPGPVTLSRRDFHNTPLLKAVFSTPEKLEELLRISPELHDFRRQAYQGTITALMTMSREEKTIFGYQQQGEMILRDVAQRSVNFFDYRLIAPAGDLDATREGVTLRGMEVLATVAMERIAALQSKRMELQHKKEYLRAALRILGGRTRIVESFAMPEPGKREEYRKAQQLLEEVERELAEAQAVIGSPEQSLGYLAEVLDDSKQVLMVDQQTLKLDWMNVLVEDTSATESNAITFAEFTVPEVARRAALLVSFSSDLLS